MDNNNLMPSNTLGVIRWNALGSEVFEQMDMDSLREFTAIINRVNSMTMAELHG